MTYHPRPERWPQVSLKSFFVLVTLLCVFLGWLGMQVKWIQDRNHFLIEELNGDERGGRTVVSDIGRKKSPWQLRIIECFTGDDFAVYEIMCHSDDPPELIRRAKALFPEAQVTND